MDKQSILIMLGSNLDNYGVPEDEILKNVKMFERYLNSLTPEEYENEIKNLDIDLLSQNIYELIKKKSPQTMSSIPTVTVKEAEIDIFEDIPIETDDVFANIDTSTNTDKDNEPKRNVNLVPVDKKPNSVTSTKNTLPSRTMKIPPVPYEQVKNPQPIDLDALDEIPDEEIPYVKGTPAFWTIFILTLPISIPILFAIFAAFFIVIAAIAVLIVGLIGGLIGIVAAGSALALIGIVYGITQTFTTLPIGLYEIGLGILIGGIAMFTGILIYNFAVRFLPFAIKYVIVFMKFTIKKIRYLFYHLKKESASR